VPDRTAVHHPIFARFYAKAAPGMERKGAGEHRDELLAGLAGRVVEVGAGNGLNFAHYPTGVTEVVAVEPEPHLRRLAEEAARTSPVPVRVVDGLAQSLPLADGALDAAVASLVLCSVPDQSDALAEIRRVLRPGGELRFYEHVRASTPKLARAQRIADVVWPWFGGGCHTSRETTAAVERAGFEILELRRFTFRPCAAAALVAPHVVGRARRPSQHGRRPAMLDAMAAPRLDPIPRERRDPRTEELLAALRATPDAHDLNIFATLAHHPKLLKRWVAFGGTLLYGGELPPRDRELLVLRTAWRCGTDYEWGHHVEFAHQTGLSDGEIERCARPLDPGAHDADAVLLRAADELHADARIGDETWAALASRYSAAQLVEVCMLVGQYHLVAFALRSLGVEREPGIVGLPG